MTSSAVTVEVLSTAPSSIVLSVGDTHYPVGQYVLLEATALDPDDNVDRVEFYEGTTLIATSYPGGVPDYYAAYWYQMTPGTYELSAKVIDAEGQELTSETVEVVREVNPGPVITWVKPVLGDRFPADPTASIDIEVTATDVHGVTYAEISAGPTAGSLSPLGTFYAPHKVTWSGLAAGTYVVQVKVFDTYNASTTEQRTVTVVTPTVVVLQEGLPAVGTTPYAGMVDTYIYSSQPNTNPEHPEPKTELKFDEGHPASTGLLYWPMVSSLTGIPTTARVLEASVTFNVKSEEDCWCVMSPINRDWVEGSATYNATGWGYNWTTPGANSYPEDCGFSIGRLKITSTGSKAIPFDSNGVATVQSWVAGGLNQGIKIEAVDNMDNTDSDPTVVSSSEDATVANRPKLTIKYY
jgi:hypothetical protein